MPGDRLMRTDRAMTHAPQRRELSPFDEGPEPARDGEESPFAIFEKIHRLLRGRYLLAIGLAAIGAAAGAIAGYSAMKPKYMSQGLIQIKPTVVGLLGDKEMPPMFTSYVRTQANLLQEPRVIDMAMHSREWQTAAQWPESGARDRFLKELAVTTDQGEPEWIRVRFLDRDGKVAKTAVERIIDAYITIWGPSVDIYQPGTLEGLQSARLRYQAEIDEVRRKIDAVYNNLGTSDIAEIQSTYTKELLALDRDIDTLAMTIREGEQAMRFVPAPGDINPELANSEISRVDEYMRALLDRRMIYKTEVGRLQEGGFQPEHPSVKRAAAALANVEKQVKEERETWLSAHNGRLPSLPGVAQTPVTKEQIALSKSRLDDLRAYRDEKQKKAKDIARQKTDVDGYLAEIKRKQDELNPIETKIGVIKLESGAGPQGSAGRIQIISTGDEPTRPYSDPRKKLGALGFVLGGGLPIGLIMLVGLFDKRYRYSEDASAAGPGNVTLLGILPYLPENMADPEQAAVAAHCVHQIRTLLQIGAVHQDRKVFAVTSPTSGDGKTSLSMSLGLSFAASGSRTLLIDFDFIGTGLSAAMQARSSRGVFDAIVEGQINGHIRKTAFPRLSIIPAGRDDAQEVSRLSPTLVRRLLDQARAQYDVVVIDTGPILGSLEASLVTAEADGVILALGRGQQRGQAERAVNHLANVGARLIGVVFNRAQPADFRRAVSSASVRSVPVASNGHGTDASKLPALGIMARTVASHIRPSEGPQTPPNVGADEPAGDEGVAESAGGRGTGHGV